MAQNTTGTFVRYVLIFAVFVPKLAQHMLISMLTAKGAKKRAKHAQRLVINTQASGIYEATPVVFRSTNHNLTKA
ncbi:hypothetical protein ABC383_06310 [Noviherbaspirillum sp. 1P10PC]|uniref:hypothetical protein n=1 Tax=Noviherbaspirillum sp. 1P10PC TaxID=3132292 RepID=UPI0039A366C4